MWTEKFPRLFAEQSIGYAQATIRLQLGTPPDSWVNRLHLVAFTADGDVVVCRSSQEWRFLPGGTREPSESLLSLATRELMEEAGAVLTSEPATFAWHDVASHADQPYRPHLAHPRAAWSYASCHVRLAGPPTNPDDGEEVVDVLALPPAEAADWLAVHDRDHADLVRLAVALGQAPAGDPDRSRRQ